MTQSRGAHALTHGPFLLVGPDSVVEGAVDAGVRPPVERVRALVARGQPVLVRCEPPPRETPGDSTEEVAEVVAMVSVYAWLGARVFATAHTREAGQALDMVASVLGLRPPATARRGLA